MRLTQVALTLAAAALLAIALSIVSGSETASADGGPHGGYTATGGTQGGLPDQCGACHRVHQGKSEGKLLKASSPYALCLTCHNGSGSFLDVLDGIRLGAQIAPDSGAVIQAFAGNLTVSVAPVAEVSIPAGEKADFTLAVRNGGVADTTATITITGTTGNVTSFGAAYLNGTPGTTTLPLPVTAGGIAYMDVHVPSTGGAGGDTVLVTVQASDASGSPAVALSARIRAATDNFDGVGNAVLNGGGFMFVAGKEVTSRHNADPADGSLNPWGFGATANTGQNPNALSGVLQCTSCHNPHGSSNYRILKETINSETVNVLAFEGGAFTKQEGNVRGLDAGAPADKYVKEYYGSSGDSALGGKGDPGIGSLCGACHTAYPSDGASTGLTAGGVTHYRHRTEMPFTLWSNPDTGLLSQNPETNPVLGTQPGQTADFPALRLASNAAQSNTIVQCLTCHRVHGSSSTMDGYALKPSVAGATGGTGLADEDLTPSQTLTDHTGNLSISTLLFTDNRGMCQACHQWGVVP